eukprot:CAMPEP_0179152372 /NCGR_PEP_ID=MMETSP0796-20121207/74038_1 /TAXON_ID=73915 /ORGANISM="Pyrodinium bahamense, Strain pbaha01" /LENGTH=631 /DNA_ID=CAMNT_0020853565 /DNA_START=79 /DNA_END=1974 /DNA_ORIENTATION=+
MAPWFCSYNRVQHQDDQLSAEPDDGGANQGRVRLTTAARTVVAPAMLILAGIAVVCLAGRHGGTPSTTIGGIIQRDAHAGHVHPAVCDKDLVAAVCAMVNRKTQEHTGTDADKDPNIVHSRELSEHLSIGLGSIRDFLRMLHMDDVAVNKAAFAVSCKQLCDKTVAHLKQHDGHAPPSSDVGCYQVNEDSLHPKYACDLDLSDDALADLDLGTQDPKALGEQNPTKETPEQKHLDELESKDEKDLDDAEKQELQELEFPARDEWDVMESILNMFHIYPPEPVHFEDRTAGDANYHGEDHRRLLERAGGVALVDKLLVAVNGTMWRAYEVFEGPPQGVGARSEVGQWDTIMGASNHTARRLAECGTTGGWRCKLPFSWNGRTYHTCAATTSGKALCPIRFVNGKWGSNDWQYCRCTAGCCPGAGNTGGGGGGGGDAPSWKIKTQKAGLQCKAMATGTLNKIGLSSTNSKFVRWFGSTRNSVKQKVRSNLAGIANVYRHADYVYHPTGTGSCSRSASSGVMAYVFQYSNGVSERNSKGAFVVHVCEFAFTFPDSTLVSTMLHEGFHHQTMLLTDVPQNGQLGCNIGSMCPYNRDNLLRVAQGCARGSSAYCSAAIRNSQTLTFFSEELLGRSR